VVRGRYSYGCSGFSSGCEFRINFRILDARINLLQAQKLLSTGFTDSLKFKSKTGKDFDSKLKLDGGKIVFDFNNG